MLELQCVSNYQSSYLYLHYSHRYAGFCNYRRVLFCNCCSPILRIDNTLGIVHLLCWWIVWNHGEILQNVTWFHSVRRGSHSNNNPKDFKYGCSYLVWAYVFTDSSVTPNILSILSAHSCKVLWECPCLHIHLEYSVCTFVSKILGKQNKFCSGIWLLYKASKSRSWRQASHNVLTNDGNVQHAWPMRHG